MNAGLILLGGFAAGAALVFALTRKAGPAPPVGNYALTVLISPPKSGYISIFPEKSGYAPGEVVTLIAIPYSSTPFLYWEYAGERIYQSTFNVLMTKDTTVVAYFGGLIY